MMYSQIDSASLNEDIARQIICQVAGAMSYSGVPVKCTEYAQSKRVNGADGGRIFTGKRTIVIEIDGGDPNLEVNYNDASCCGG